MSTFDRTIEPLLREEEKRYVVFPIVYPKYWNMYKRALASFWTVEEVDLSRDRDDWNDKLTQVEREFLKHVFAFFAASDGLVNENLLSNFSLEIQPLEARAFYISQMGIEVIHNEMYSLLIETFSQDAAEKQKLFASLETIPCIKQKADWAIRWTDSRVAPFNERLIAFTAVEGIFFSGSFVALFWLKKRGLMPGTTFSNELISRDEGLHCEFACMLHDDLVQKVPANRIIEIIGAAVKIEQEFLQIAMPVSMIGLNCTDMCNYIEYIADQLYIRLGVGAQYHSQNPFNFMTSISLAGKSNFFEKRVGEYAKNMQLSVSDNLSKTNFVMDADF